MNEQATFDFSAGARLRDEGIARAVEHADDETPSWSEVAYGYVVLFARRRVEFQCEDVRAEAESRGFAKPPDGRASGAAILRASKAGIIRRVGFAPMKSPNCHANPKSVWIGR